MKLRNGKVLALLLLFGISGAFAAVPRHVPLASLSANTREVLQQSLEFDAHFWDESAKLVHNPSPAHNGVEAGHYMVRESSWYALGLLLRDAPGDRRRAAAILDAVLKQQYLTPGVKWYGTYRRTPEEPDPSGNSIAFRGYDPNWR